MELIKETLLKGGASDWATDGWVSFSCIMTRTRSVATAAWVAVHSRAADVVYFNPPRGDE